MKSKIKYLRNACVIGTLLFVLPSTNLFASADPPAILLINEVMYHPVENEGTNEWIELYNPSTVPIDISGWTLADEKGTDSLQADPDHGDGTTVIPPRGYAIISDIGNTIYETFTIDENAVRLSVDDSTLCGYGLNNQQEKLILMDATGTVIDAMEWGNEYDDVPGKPAPLVTKGNSLARVQDTDDSSVDFVETTTPTPGSANIITGQDDQQNHTAEGTSTTVPRVLITELYYHTHANIDDEFVRICNPTSMQIDVSGWYLTDKPWKEPDDQPKIIFPQSTVLPANTSWFITNNATDFLWETEIGRASCRERVYENV
jgi:hypothetical protein